MDRTTIEELATLSGVTVRSIRSYQALGMLQGPQRVGRVGYYGREHLARLRLIRNLQERGFSRASITSLVNARDAGHTLRDVLGSDFEEALTPLTDLPQACEISQEAATAFLAGHVDRALEFGFLTAVGDRYRVWNRELLQVGVELMSIGIPLSLVLDEAEALMQETEATAQRFVGLFLDQIWQPYVDRGHPDDELELVTEKLRRLTPLVHRSVDAALRQAIAVAVAEAVTALFPAAVADRVQSVAG